MNAPKQLSVSIMYVISCLHHPGFSLFPYTTSSFFLSLLVLLDFSLFIFSYFAIFSFSQFLIFSLFSFLSFSYFFPFSWLWLNPIEIAYVSWPRMNLTERSSGNE